MNMQQLKKTLITHVQIPNTIWRPQDSHVSVDRKRTLKWRDQGTAEGRVLIVMAVPTELVDDVLATFGKRGLTIDLGNGRVKKCTKRRRPEFGSARR